MELISVGRAEHEADLRELREWESSIRYAQARKQQVLAKLGRTTCAEDLVPAGLDKHYTREEVSCDLRITPDTARSWLADAVDAQACYPELNKLLEVGETTFAHCLAFTNTARALDDEEKRALLDLVFEKARTQSVVEFRATLAKALMTLRPVGEEKTRQQLVESRHVTVRHSMSGMSAVVLDMPTEDAVLSVASIETLARQWAQLPGQVRTLEQLRLDAASHLLQGGDPAGHRIGVNVCLTLDTLTGAGDEPGELDIPLPRALGGGIVPVTAEHARQLAATAEKFRRFLTDPAGQLLDYGRSLYRPPAALARYVRARDRHCTFPHCTRPALSCDLDHRRAWECGGETCEFNIDCLCERHHYLKHNTSWNVQRLTDGTRHWTSPGGRLYTRPPATYPVSETRSSTTDPLFRQREAPDELNAPADRSAPDDPPPF